MARGVNKAILIGNLGRDPELTYTPNGTAIAKFPLATTESRKNQEGNWEDATEWHNIKLFGKTAEVAGQYLAKGSQVYIEGRISTRNYEQEGVKKYFTEIIGFQMQMLGRRDDASRPAGETPREKGSPPPPPEAEPHGEEVEDDLPF
jgi:single-strand DNA-binding protein